MQPTCIFCGKNTDLNTQLTISLGDGNKVSVDICDEHAEDATVKTARAKYVEKQAQITAFMEQAKALGLEIKAPSSGSGLVTVQKTQEIIPTARQIVEPTLTVDSKEEEDGWVPTAKVDAADRKGMRSVGGSTEMGGVSGHSSYTIGGQKDSLDEAMRRGKVRMVVQEGRAGAPIVVPQKRVDGTGTTRIRIVKNESDDSLQRRFKGMAQDSKQDRQPDFRNGYDESTRTCPICRGDCVVNDQDCPKCDGLGIISVY